MGFWAALEEVYPTSCQQRCSQHKTMNMLNCLPKLSRPKAKAAIHNIWQAETKEDAEKAFDFFIKTYEAKYPKATLCLQKDRTELMAFFDFPAQHWQSSQSVQPETNDHRRMALASKRWLHKINPVEPQILTDARNLGISNLSPLIFENYSGTITVFNTQFLL